MDDTVGSHGDLATPARELLLALLTRLSDLGYSLHTSLLSSPGSDKDSLILRKTPRTTGAMRQFFAVCFYKTDKIKVIDCPDESVKEAVSTAIKVRSPIKISSLSSQGEGEADDHGVGMAGRGTVHKGQRQEIE